MSLCYFYNPLNTNLCPTAFYPQPQATQSSAKCNMKGHARRALTADAELTLVFLTNSGLAQPPRQTLSLFVYSIFVYLTAPGVVAVGRIF